MNRVFSVLMCVVFLSLMQSAFAQNKEAAAPVNQDAQEEKEDARVKFDPSNKRDPFLSKEEVSKIERDRRADAERIEKERKAKEAALIAARDAEKARIEREAYLKANPHLAIVGKIKIQGMMGDEVQINNDFKAVGDKVAGATITKITGTRIYFKYKGKDFSMSIPKPKE